MRCPTLADLPPPPPGKSGWPWIVETPQLPLVRKDGSAWPRISIVTPSYNQGNFIEETIRSVLLQGYPNIEYIVVDGDSSDRTQEIIERYKPWLAHSVSEKDRGQSHAINKGFATSTGTVLGWLCSDDILLQNALLRVADSIRDSEWIIGSAHTMDEDSIQRVCVTHRNYRRFDVIYNSYIINQVSVFWSRSLLDRVGEINEELHFAMDGELWMRFELKCAPRVIDGPLGAFRIHKRQKTYSQADHYRELWSAQKALTKNRFAAKASARLWWKVRTASGRLGIGGGTGNGFRPVSEQA